MTKTTIFCDVCGYQFSGNEHWEAKPTKVAFNFSYPRQAFESFEKEHVCYDCVKAIQQAIFDAWKSLEKKS